CGGRRRQLSGLARGAPRRAGDPYRLSRRPRVTVTGTYRRLGAVSEGRTTRETMLPRVPSSQTKRWRAAMLLPHSNPPQIFVGQNRVKVKTPLKPGQDVTPRQTGAQGRNMVCDRFMPDMRPTPVVTL